MKIKNYRWVIVVLIFIATTINYMDRQIIGLLKPVLEAEFSWTETDFAHIIMAFTAAYAIGLLVMGRFIDWIGTKLGYAFSVALWSIAGMLHAVVRSVGGFSAARVGLGLGEAGNFPAGMKAISEWFPKKEKGIATGIFNAGASVGVVVALIVCPLILNAYGWHEVFWITGGVGLIWIVFWLLFYDIPSRQKRLTVEEYNYITEDIENNKIEKQETNKISWISLFVKPQTWVIIVGKFFIDPIYWFFLFWLPSYFAINFELDLTKPSLPLMTIYAATTIGSIFGGWLSSKFIKRGWGVLKARKTTLLIFALLETGVIFMQFITNVWVAVAVLSVAVALHQGWATNIFTLASDIFPNRVVSSVTGIAGMAGAVGGILFPILVGSLLDHYKLLGDISIGYNIIFTICGFTYLIVWTIIRLLMKRMEKNQ